jgi:hypothetical protein
MIEDCRGKSARTASLALTLVLLPALARAAALDVSSEYRMRALQYSNLNLDAATPNNRSLLSQQARLGVTLKDIPLPEVDGGEKATMDVAIKLHALGVAGSTTPFQVPFQNIAANYPNTQFVPFFENAYVEAHNLAGGRWDLRVGRQSFRLGSGLLLDDDGAGFTGITARAPLPWWGMRAEGFVFQINNQQTGPNNLDAFGFTLELPTDGLWQLNQLVEKDRTPQVANVTGCTGGCAISKATRSFTSARYQISYGPLVFDGEAAIERGVATPTGPTPLGSHITYSGDAEVVRAKWKQTFYKDVKGIARASVARGSGDNASTSGRDEAFFPSHGHRYDGMERVGMGFGEFFSATPYDAFGGKSTSTVSGLQPGSSGVLAVGLGLTPPAWHGIALDLDYYLYQADRSAGPARSLGREYDVRLRYDLGERLTFRASAAFFKAGAALDPGRSNAHRLAFEATGHF